MLQDLHAPRNTERFDCDAHAGAGRRVGENCEQLWALLRALLKLTRYMTKDAYIFCLDDALLLIADDKLQHFIDFATQQQAAMEEKLGECKADGLREQVTRKKG